MIDRKIPVRDYCAGAFVVLVGAWALWEASHYAFGSLRSIGSGFFPSMLGLLAIPLGVAIVWEAATRPANAATDAAPDDRISESIEFRPIAAVVAALLAVPPSAAA